MTTQTILFGGLLVALGVYGYTTAGPAAGSDRPSPTALIPAAFGAVLAVCGVLGARPALRKHVMHFAAMVGLLGIVGGFVPLIRQAAKGDGVDASAPAARNGLLMSLVCAAFVFQCVRFFVDGRREKRLAAGRPAA